MSSFLDALTDEEVAHLRARGVVRRFPRGDALFHERQVSDRVMVLVEGRVKIASTSEDGHESVLAFRGPGEVLWELSAIDGKPRSAGVTAVDPVEALVIPTRDFRAFLERSPRAAPWILTRLSARLREADRMRARWVETERRAITVLDMEALRTRAGCSGLGPRPTLKCSAGHPDRVLTAMPDIHVRS
jgi:CRP/FNR family transcriptional regulator, cyclic AMP receptor protein